jgi:hypothetical protein
MNVGFVNMFAFRPHVEHLYYLSRLVKLAGHNDFYLTCDSSVGSCYARELKGTTRLIECSKCVVGGIRSFPVSNVTSIDRRPKLTGNRDLDLLTLSSSATLGRIEDDDELMLPRSIDIRERLRTPVHQTFLSAKRWIEENQIDGVICFNGRMDLTRAVTFACEETGVPFITHERPWFGHGLHLTPNGSCLSLKHAASLCGEYQFHPLTKTQAELAGSIIGQRFLQQNTLEWRLYNTNPVATEWPVCRSGPRVLILPSSRNEMIGEPEWQTSWRNNIDALNDLLSVFSISPNQVVLRAHPNWSESIGNVDGNVANRLYSEWAKKRGVYHIASYEKASTYDLIEQADIVVVNNGSSAIEAGACGKQIICLSASVYENAGFVRTFRNRESMELPGAKDELDEDTVRRNTLRFVYLAAKRNPQFVDYVRAVKTTSYEYIEGADPERLLEMFRTGKLIADDQEYDVTDSAENTVLELMKAAAWQQLANVEESVIDGVPMAINRREVLFWLDGLRERMKHGDR